jgi:hypothetical protein
MFKAFIDERLQQHQEVDNDCMCCSLRTKTSSSDGLPPDGVGHRPSMW